MTLALRRVKVYLKLVAILAAVVIALLVVWKNRGHKADVWFFVLYHDVNVLTLMLVAAAIAVAGHWGVRKVFRVVRELREVRRLEREQARLDEQRRLARELAEREKRIDEKVSRAIREES